MKRILSNIISFSILFIYLMSFSTGSVMAKPESFTNTMEVNKTYWVNMNGLGWWASTEPNIVDINVYRGWSDIYDDCICMNSSPNDKNDVFKQCYNPGQDMRTADTYGTHLWDSPVVSVIKITSGSDIFGVTPLVAGNFTTKTQHKWVGDKTYYWNFVNTGR